MTFVLDFVQSLLGNKVFIDDGVDRVNRKYMVILILICLIIIVSGQFLRGDQIQCFPPVYFSGEQAEYAESICWTRSTWYLVDDKENGKELRPEDDAGAMRNMIYYSSQTDQNGYYETGYVGPHTKVSRVRVSYYQWTPIILGLEAACFLLPYLVWHIFASASGLPMVSMIKAAKEMAKVQPEEGTRENYCRDLLDRYTKYIEKTHVDKTIIMPAFLKKIFRMGRHYGNYIFFMYCGIKVLYMINCVCQIMLLKLFFGNDPRIDILQHGLWVLEGLFYDGTWRHSPWFPVETVCHFKAEQQGNPVPYTLECILPLNLYNDKFFALFTILFPVLLLLNLINLIYWLVCNSAWGRRRFVKIYLAEPLNLADGGKDKDDVHCFAEEYLRRDGIFVLQMIEMNVGGIIVEHVLEKLFDQYLADKWAAVYDEDGDDEKKLLGLDSLDGKGTPKGNGVPNDKWSDKDSNDGRPHPKKRSGFVRSRWSKKNLNPNNNNDTVV